MAQKKPFRAVEEIVSLLVTILALDKFTRVPHR